MENKFIGPKLLLLGHLLDGCQGRSLDWKERGEKNPTVLVN